MSTHQIYFHLAWTTRDRAPMIDAATRTFLDAFFRRTAAREHADIVALAILRTHTWAALGEGVLCGHRGTETARFP
jgi:REP element-mobilizing transposase RayT